MFHYQRQPGPVLLECSVTINGLNTRMKYLLGQVRLLKNMIQPIIFKNIVGSLKGCGKMSKKSIRRPQAPKIRNWVAKQVRDTDGPYRPKVIKNKIKNKRPKYPIKVDFDQ
ncbi:MAG: hypothetical protein CMQ88_02175 [Gammaproteobacteria bacterium]|nr:hypothetical protein [Gammaproteobacteria bacterium]|tara:strand:- start:649 stop:981 length:333 start_codon:yes stop_codon:yes gene_type:complete